MNSEIYLSLPIIIITVFGLIAVTFDAFIKSKNVGYFISILGLLAGGVSAGIILYEYPGLVNFPETESLLSAGLIKFGGYTAFFDLLFCVAGLLTIFSSRPFFRREYKEYNEYYSMLLFAISGMMTIAHANHMLTLFIGVEIMSICFYVLSGFIRTNKFAVEAALKYFLLGAFASGFLAYGMALIYGTTGTMSFPIITKAINLGVANPTILLIGVGLMIVGLAFKVAIFPFHQWAPDVYSGSPTVVTGFMSTAGKAAALIGFVVIARTIMPVVGGSQIETLFETENIQMLIAILSAATMLVGNITALVQKNVKRMLAYSSVAHAGYLLMGIVANNQQGWSGIAFYAMAYMFMQIGAFAVVGVIERKNSLNLDLSDYSGLSKTSPMLAGLMALFMLSLAGIPPMAGFLGKYYLFIAAVEAGFTWLTIVAVISSMISVYFYIGLIVYMYFKQPGENKIEAKLGGEGITLIVSAVCVLAFGIYPTMIVDLLSKCF
jgi:NADH-quinone oxidoreductase subunit N